MAQTIYRIRIIFIGKATERTLPYEFTDQVLAEQTASTLNSLLLEEGYRHEAYPTQVQSGNGKQRTK